MAEVRSVHTTQVGRTRNALRMSDEGAGGIFVNSAGAHAAAEHAATSQSLCMASHCAMLADM